MSRVDIRPVLPSYGSRAEQGEQSEVLKRMVGATIINIGQPASSQSLEGGGFAVEFRRPGADEAETVVFAFNELGMWVED